MKKYILKFKGQALLYLIMGVIISLNGVALTFGIQYIVEIVSNKQTEKVPNMFYVILIFLGAMAVVDILYAMAKNRFCVNVMQAIRTDLFKSLIRENVVVFSKENTGYYTSLFQNDLAVVEKTLIAYFALCMQIEELVFSLAYAFLQNVTVGLMLIVVGVAGMIIPILAQKILRKNQETLMNEAAKHNGFINDNLRGYEVIKNYQIEENIVRNYEKVNHRYGKKSFHTTFFQNVTNNMTQTFLVSMQMLLIAIAGIMVLKGRANISFMTVIVGLSSSVIGSMCSAVEAFIERKAGQGVCRKIFKQIEECEENTGKTEASFEDSLALKHISFTYPNAEKPVLENIDISFQKGKKYLIIGESGSGKSTFIKLLLQYYEDYQGEISLDGTDVRNMPAQSVMREFAVIPQNVFVFEDTLRNNITLYHSYSDESVMEAVKKAGLTGLVDKLENGLDYVIKEGGLNLSGGERQRISIARAFLQNRKIWIMDEATSNLDKGMAEQIEQTVLDIPDITVIMIAHYCNAKTVERCDEIYKLENKCLNKVEKL